MGAQLRVYRRQIKSVKSTQKITKAMELIAASRIVKAQNRITAARPYARELTRALAALGKNASVKNPLLTGVQSPRRTGILLVTSDRGLAGGYSANAIKAANELAERLRSEGREPVRYVIGRKGVTYYRFRQLEVAKSWTGFSEQPSFSDVRDATEMLVGQLKATSEGQYQDQAGLDELYVVYTRFESMITQVQTAELVSPVSRSQDQAGAGSPAAAGSPSAGGSEAGDGSDVTDGPTPSYDFEPEPEELLVSLLPRYISARIFSALLESAASESASRRRAMKSASDNASDLIGTYTRLANQARQAEITQEISEIIGGADALESAGSE